MSTKPNNDSSEQPAEVEAAGQLEAVANEFYICDDDPTAIDAGVAEQALDQIADDLEVLYAATVEEMIPQVQTLNGIYRAMRRARGAFELSRRLRRAKRGVRS